MTKLCMCKSWRNVGWWS